MRRGIFIAASAAAVLVSGIAWAGSEEPGTERRSGTIVRIDREDREAAAVLLRVGPWRIKDEDVAPGSTPLRITLRPTTEVRVLNRAAGAASPPRPEDIVATSTTPAALDVGVYATITYRQDGTELIAERIDLIPSPLGWNPTRPSPPGGLIVRPK